MKLNFKEHKYSGKLITFCGLDGCGKTTMIDLLNEYLLNIGYHTCIIKQPSDLVRSNSFFRTSIDKPYLNKVDQRAVSLFCVADKLQCSTKEIEPLLSKGYIVLSDRYLYSSLANLYANDLHDEKWLKDLSEHFVKPDISFFLNVSVNTAINRVKSRAKEKDRYIDTKLQHALNRAYVDIAINNDGVIIDCESEIYNSFDIIKKRVSELI